VLASSTRLEDVPLADCFSVEDVLVLRSSKEGKQVTASLTFEVRFLKTVLVKAFIEASTNPEMKKWLKVFIEETRQAAYRIANRHSSISQRPSHNSLDRSWSLDNHVSLSSAAEFGDSTFPANSGDSFRSELEDDNTTNQKASLVSPIIKNNKDVRTVGGKSDFIVIMLLFFILIIVLIACGVYVWLLYVKVTIMQNSIDSLETNIRTLTNLLQSRYKAQIDHSGESSTGVSFTAAVSEHVSPVSSDSELCTHSLS